MASSKHSLIIDGNFFLFKTLFVLPKSKKRKLMDTDEERGVFLRKLSQDFAAEMRKFGTIMNRAVFTIDSSSWRKDFYPKAEYKGQRVADDSVNWENVWDTFREFTDIIKSKGVIVHKVPGAEGDDIIFAWATYLNLQGENAIINSGDRDLTQLVKYHNTTNCYTLFYTNTQKVLMVYPGFMDWLGTSDSVEIVDVFDMSRTVKNKNNVKDTINQLVAKNNLKMSEVVGDKVALGKVLGGDGGDNIKAAYWYTTKNKNGKSRTFGVSDKKVEKIVAQFEENNGEFKMEYLFEPSYREDFRDILVEQLKADKMTPEQILENIELNVNLVVLHTTIIPQPIQDQMFKNVEMMYKLDTLKLANVSNKEVILEGTSYLEESYTPNSYNVFGNSKKDDMSFIKKDDDTTSSKSLF